MLAIQSAFSSTSYRINVLKLITPHKKSIFPNSPPHNSSFTWGYLLNICLGDIPFSLCPICFFIISALSHCPTRELPCHLMIHSCLFRNLSINSQFSLHAVHILDIFLQHFCSRSEHSNLDSQGFEIISYAYLLTIEYHFFFLNSFSWLPFSSWLPLLLQRANTKLGHIAHTNHSWLWSKLHSASPTCKTSQMS